MPKRPTPTNVPTKPPRTAEKMGQLSRDAGVAPSPGEPAEGRPQGPRQARPRGRRIDVWVTPDERSEIQRRAELGGLSLSNYLRTAGLNHPIRSVLDYQAVGDLVAVAGDLGRLGGLFKLWLAERRGEGATVGDVNKALLQARGLQDRIRQLLGRL